MENIILIILIILLLGCVYFRIRLIKVYKFRIYIADLIHSKVSAMIEDGAFSPRYFNLCDKLDDISYEKMLFSFKPLKMEYWFTDDELKLLGYESK